MVDLSKEEIQFIFSKLHETTIVGKEAVAMAQLLNKLGQAYNTIQTTEMPPPPDNAEEK